MIYLLATVLVILPLVILGCIKGDVKAEKVVHSTEAKPKKTAVATPPSSKPPRHPTQPHSDGSKDVATSTTKKEETDKQTTTNTTSKGRAAKPATPPPEHFRRDESARKFETSARKFDASGRKWSPRAHYLEPMLSSQRRRSPEMVAKQGSGVREPARTPGGQRRASPGARSGVPLTSRMSKKSRKATQPRSPSMKEFPAIPKVTITQSKTDLTTLVSMKNTEGNKSALTALSEYVFQETKYKVLGKVDGFIGESDEIAVLNKALKTEQSLTCLSATSPARSPYFDGQFDIWIADRVGSQAEG